MSRSRRIALLVFAGLPISLLALALSFVAFMGFTSEFPDPISFGLLAACLGALWAIFTGLRNLWRFDSAHLDLRWHDWIGGLLGFGANAWLIFSALLELFRFFMGYQDYIDWISILPLFYASTAAAACFLMVAFRWLRQNFVMPNPPMK